LTSEGTSNAFQSTELARGTSGYRAPEIVSEARHVYNNKADIWAMGCILHELATGRKAFHTDVAVLEHRLSGAAFTVTIDRSFSEFSRGAIHGRIHEMLQIEPSSRPAASSLYETFSALYIHVKSQQPLAIAKAAQEDMRKTMFGLERNYSSIREKFLRVRDSLQAEVAVLAEEKKNLQSSNESLARDNQKMSVDTHKFRVQYMAIEEDMQRSRKERAMLESQHEMLRINFGAEMERFHADNEKLRTSMTKLTEEKSVLQSENEKLRIKVANVPIQPRPHNDSDIRRLVEASRSPVNVAEAAKRESGTAKVSTASTASVPPDEGSLETKLGPTFGSADPIAARSTGPISEVMKPSRWQVLRSSFKQQ